MKAAVTYLLMLQKYINSKQVSEMKDYTPCLGNISKDFTTNNMKETRLKVVVNFFQLILILLIQMIF